MNEDPVARAASHVEAHGRGLMETFRTITHTPAGRPGLVGPAIVVEVVRFMGDVIRGPQPAR